jgi:hypothetical protein
MTILSPQVHRVLDFLTVVAFALAPSVLHLAGAAAVLAYVLAGVHLTVTLATEFPEGRRKPLPFRGHGVLEVVVGIALIVLPFITGWAGSARTFYVAAGAVILGVWALTSYKAQPARTGTSPAP